MSKDIFLSPKNVKTRLHKLFCRRLSDWLMNSDNDQMQISIHLGLPNEKIALKNLSILHQWISQWQSWRGPGTVQWVIRRWPSLGEQQLPEQLQFLNIDELTQYIDEQNNWQCSLKRYREFVRQWPMLRQIISHQYDLLANYSDADICRLISILQWLIRNPHSQIYSRQLPLPGIDTKWLEMRKKLISNLLISIRNDQSTTDTDFYNITGFKREPTLLRVRILDPKLRAQCGGLSDISAPLTDLAQLTLSVQRVFIVENLRTGLAFGDLPDSIVFMKLGYAVDCLSQIPWIMQTNCYYWGDIDTHGFAILNRARQYIQHLQSLLMDERTLFNNEIYWVSEETPSRAEKLDYLTPEENKLYENLQNNIWRERIRLEQERIPWDKVWTVVLNLIKS